MNDSLRQVPGCEFPRPAISQALPRRTRPYLLAALISGALLLLLWFTKSQEVNWYDALLAALIIFVPAAIYANWQENSRTAADPVVVPTVFFTTAAFAVTFGFGLFWSKRTVGTVDGTEWIVPPTTITILLITVLAALLGIYSSVKSRAAAMLTWSKTLELKPGVTTWNYVRAILVVGTILASRENINYIAGEGGRALILTLQTDLPTLAFGLLLRQYLRGQGTKLDAVLLTLCTGEKVISALSSGWINPLVNFALMYLIIYRWERRRMPLAAIATVLAYVVFLQPGKGSFRDTYWYGQGSGSKIERMGFWFNASMERWTGVVTGRSGERVADLLASTTERTSLVALTSQVYDFTPSIVPFQRGATYLGLFYAVIPRAFWPNKPSVSAVNHFYQVSYRLTREENLDSVSIAPGLLGEAYMNFGWAGIVLIPFILGMLYDYVQRQLGSVSSGVLLNTFAILVTVHFTLIESHLGSYLGSLPQQLLVLCAVLAPILQVRDRATAQYEGIGSPVAPV